MARRTVKHEPETTYKIVRKFRDTGLSDVLATGMTRAEASEHCSDTETSSSTCTSAEGQALTERCGPWFDCFYEE
jgi:hypothetical protein